MTRRGLTSPYPFDVSPYGCLQLLKSGRDSYPRCDAGGTAAVTQATFSGSVHQPERHDERQEARRIVPADGLTGRGALGSLERHLDLVGRHVLEDLEHVRRIEADLQGLAVVADGDFLLRLAQLRGLDRKLAGAVGQVHPDPWG